MTEYSPHSKLIEHLIIMTRIEYDLVFQAFKSYRVYMTSDEEVHQIWEIVGNALDRNGFQDADGELSIRVYDETLKRNVKVLDKSLL